MAWCISTSGIAASSNRICDAVPTDAYVAILSAPFAALGVRLDASGELAGIDFLPGDTPARTAGNPAVRRLQAELAAYFADPGHRFTLAALPPGTPFRRRVWAAIAAIPAGHTQTYGDIARALGSAPRAVGQAAGDNPLPILIPCHRVVAAGGLGGFMHGRQGFALAAKRWLLRHEGLCFG